VRRAMTLIEILVVIGIIALLAALLMAALPSLRARASNEVAASRMQAVIGAFDQAGQSMRSLTMQAQRNITGLGGVVAFAGSQPAPGETWHHCWPHPSVVGDRGQPLITAYPLGKRRRYFLTEPWYAGPQGLPMPQSDGRGNISQMPRADRLRWERPEPIALSQLRSRRSAELLHFCELLDDVADYGPGDPDAPFRDPWGQPLVVAYALFQPPKHDLAADVMQIQSGEDHYVDQAQTIYNHSRSLTIAVASGGRRGAARTGGDPEAIWTLANEVANREGGTELWRVDDDTNAFVDPPWSGVRIPQPAADGQQPLLGAPATFR